MKVLLHPRRLILLFILVTPIVNNMNGFIFWRWGVFTVGPVFYACMLGVICFSLSSLRFERRALFNNYLIFSGIAGWYAFHAALYGGLVESFRYYIKFFMPFLTYRFLHLYFGNDRKPILDCLAGTILVWAGMAIATATLGLKPSAGEGYYGFINGNNDYVVMLFALYPTLSWWRNRFLVALYYVALFLTRSKGLLLLGIAMIFQQRSLKIQLYAILAMLVIGAYYVDYFKNNYVAHYDIGWYQIVHFATFGRIHTLLTLINHLGDKTAWEHLFGSGIAGSFVMTEGKGNVEMDLPDVYNMFGIAGLILVTWFYYWGVAKHPRLSLRTKIGFIPLFILSAVGGHFFFNSVSNTVFALILFVSREPGIFSAHQVAVTPSRFKPSMEV